MNAEMAEFQNPFRPGAGHMPPYLAGRENEEDEFRRLLRQDVVLENLVLTGLRGVGKTVLLETFKPIALQSGWLWVGTDLSESASVSEANLAIRILTDLSVVTSSIVIGVQESKEVGFLGEGDLRETKLSFANLKQLYDNIPGLGSDKLKGVLEFVWEKLPNDKRGIIFAYDEAQNLADQVERDEHPLSLLLDLFQSIQKKNIRFMLALTGLPTLFPKLVEARTFAERMFRVVFLDQLDEAASRDAILKPVERAGCPIVFTPESVDLITKISGGYPYFIQFICREVYDVWVQSAEASIPVEEITQKLDTDFFAGRWARATDRQRELMAVIAELPNSELEFTVQEVVKLSSEVSEKPFSSSHVNQMLGNLAAGGLIYKNRYGKYSFAVPLFSRFIQRQMSEQPFQTKR
ncbi:MAG: AAA family ATPase [Nitrospinales bacterium]